METSDLKLLDWFLDPENTEYQLCLGYPSKGGWQILSKYCMSSNMKHSPIEAFKAAYVNFNQAIGFEQPAFSEIFEHDIDSDFIYPEVK